ncbi:MAG: hypothetical protein V3R81_11420 [Gammaproteobacteria bacterium]
MTELSFEDRLELIESGYEFLLAYAAQGRESDVDAGGGPKVRDILDDLLRGLAGIHDSVAADEQALSQFLDVLEQDANKASAAINLVLAQPHISSQLVDNLNASIHVRAMLTDLFLIDEAIKRRAS